MLNNLLGSVAILDLEGCHNFSVDVGKCSVNQLFTTFLVKNQTKRATLQIDKSIFPDLPELTNVFAFIEANYRQSIKLSDVAKAVNYSPAYLTNLVRRLSGKTVIIWITERRMVEAASLLLETDWKIEEIALAVGYSDVGYFFRLFRKYYKTTPQVWRKAQRPTR